MVVKNFYILYLASYLCSFYAAVQPVNVDTQVDKIAHVLTVARILIAICNTSTIKDYPVS